MLLYEIESSLRTFGTVAITVIFYTVPDSECTPQNMCCCRQAGRNERMNMKIWNKRKF